MGGVQFVATPAQHFSGRGLRDGNQTLWGSWVIYGGGDIAKGEALPGEDLYAGLLKIFIGTRPVDTKLKAGLLGET